MTQPKKQMDLTAQTPAAPLPHEVYRVTCHSTTDRPKSRVLAQWLLGQLNEKETP